MYLRPLLPLTALLLMPTLALFAAEPAAKPAPAPATAAPKIKPVQAVPVTVASTAYLIDKAVPAYGAQNQAPHYTDSRAQVIYLEIHQYLADVESRVMAGEGTTHAVDKKGQPVAPVNDDAHIKDLLAQLTALDQTVAYRNYLEQWHIDNSYADLGCAAELLRLRGEVAVATVDKIKATKPVEQPKKAAPEKKPAAAAPAAKAPAAPAPAPKAATPAPEAPAAPAPAPAPAAEAPAAPAPAPEAPPAAPPAEAPAAPAVEAPPAAPPAEAPAAPPADK